MKTQISLVSMVTLLTTLIIVPSAQAFTLELPLEDQIALYNQTVLNESNVLTLLSSGDKVEHVSVSPDWIDDQIVYAGTTAGTYVNSTGTANFYQDISMPEEVVNGSFKVEFGSRYNDEGIALVYNENNVFITFNKGTVWNEIDLDTNEAVEKAWPGPAYGQTPYVYFLTSSGLYRQSTSGNTAELMVASDGEGEVTDFAFSPGTNRDDIFYVVKGTKVLKTENFGTSWFEHNVGSPINKLIIVDKDSDTDHGEAVVFAGKKTVQKSDVAFTFISLDIPEEITEIYDLELVENGNDRDYLLLTDMGLYSLFNEGSTSAKVESTLSNYNNLEDLFVVQEGSYLTMIYIQDGMLYLYRNVAGNGNPEPYMDGIDVANVFATEGSAESHNLLDLSEDTFPANYVVDEAILVADVDAMEQTLTFFMTADGENWEEVAPNESHTFENQGNDLRWRAELATTDTQVSPVIDGINVEFGMIEGEEPAPEDGLCQGFTDVQAQDPLCPALSYVKEQGIFEGYPDGTFQPNQAINRAETVKVIVEGFNVPQLADPGTNLGFSDVILGEWYMPYLATAQAEGIIEGYPDGTFKPEQTVNYVELIKIFFETAEVALTPAAEGTQWYQTYLNYAMNNDYLVYQMLDAGMKRGDVATLFYQHSTK